MTISVDRHGAALGALAVALLVWAPRVASNGSFGLPFDSVAGSGLAFAGVDADRSDAGAAARNPALHGATARTSLTFGGHLAYYSTEFSGDAERTDTDGSTIDGGQGGDPGRLDLPLPDIVLSHRLNRRWAVGVSLSAPYGITLRFDPDWVGRYHSVDAVIRGVELVPAVAWQAQSWLRLGVGLRAQVFDSEFANAVDIGSYVQQEVVREVGLDATTPACVLAGEPTLPGKYDVLNRLESREFALGWQAGLRAQITPGLAWGLSYRSPIDHGLSGRAGRERDDWTLEDFDSDPCLGAVRVGLAALGRSYEEEVLNLVEAASTDTRFRTDIQLPETLSSALIWQRGRWAVASTLRWTRWSRLQAATVRFDNATPTVVEPLRFNDSVLVAVGLRYRLFDRWTVSAGYAQSSSTVDDTTRSARAPDSDRTYLSGGLRWQAMEHLALVLSAGVIRGKAAVVEDRTEATGTGHVLSGQFEPLTLVWGGSRLEWRF